MVTFHFLLKIIFMKSLQIISVFNPIFLVAAHNRDDYWGGGKMKIDNETHPAQPGSDPWLDPLNTSTVTGGCTPH